jgi:hypothetical protein
MKQYRADWVEHTPDPPEVQAAATGWHWAGSHWTERGRHWATRGPAYEPKDPETLRQEEITEDLELEFERRVGFDHSPMRD